MLHDIIKLSVAYQATLSYLLIHIAYIRWWRIPLFSFSWQIFHFINIASYLETKSQDCHLLSTRPGLVMQSTVCGSQGQYIILEQMGSM